MNRKISLIFKIFILFLYAVTCNRFCLLKKLKFILFPPILCKVAMFFFNKGCASCHKVWGIGTDFGPDLTSIGKEKNFFELAGDLWRHSPKMMEVMREKDIPIPALSPKEIEQLMAYLYYLGFFDELGDYLKGEKVFREKGCFQCHSLGGEKRKVGPNLDKYGQYLSPVFMVTALWNHVQEMEKMVTELNLAWPRFENQEMKDLLVYIQSLK